MLDLEKCSHFSFRAAYYDHQIHRHLPVQNGFKNTNNSYHEVKPEEKCVNPETTKARIAHYEIIQAPQ